MEFESRNVDKLEVLCLLSPGTGSRSLVAPVICHGLCQSPIYCLGSESMLQSLWVNEAGSCKCPSFVSGHNADLVGRGCWRGTVGRKGFFSSWSRPRMCMFCPYPTAV